MELVFNFVRKCQVRSNMWQLQYASFLPSYHTSFSLLWSHRTRKGNQIWSEIRVERKAWPHGCTFFCVWMGWGGGCLKESVTSRIQWGCNPADWHRRPDLRSRGRCYCDPAGRSIGRLCSASYLLLFIIINGRNQEAFA